MKDYTHAKKILTALEEEKEIECSIFPDKWTRSEINKSVAGWCINAINDSKFLRVKPVAKKHEVFIAKCNGVTNVLEVGTQLHTEYSQSSGWRSLGIVTE